MTLDRRLKRTLLWLVLVAFASHSLALRGLLPGALPSTGDTIGGFTPWHIFERASFWSRGEMPLWDPHLYCGVPFFSNGQSGLVYPPNLLFALPAENVALWLYGFGHSVFLMFGCYFLGRTLGLKRRASFLFATVFGLGGAVPAHLFGGHLTFLPVRSYWPWEAAFLIRLLKGQGRGNAAALAACLALGLAAGAPQVWLFGLLICCGVFVLTMWGRPWADWRRIGPPLLGCAVLTALWCAPIVLPLRELRDWSSHGDSMSFTEVTNLSATYRSLFRLLFNDFFGGNSSFMWSLPFNPGEDAASIGLAALLLGVLAPFCARKSRAVPALLVFCGVMLLLALGRATPLYHFLYDHSTMFRILRVPARWLELWAFGAALLAGYAFDGLLRKPSGILLMQRLFLAATVACGALWLAAWVVSWPWQEGAHVVIYGTGAMPAMASRIASGLQRDALVSCFLNGACVGASAWVAQGRSAKGLKGLNVSLLLVLFAAAPLLSFWHATKIGLPRMVQVARLPQAFAVQYKTGERWVIHAPFTHLNAPIAAGVDVLNGYEPFGSTPFFEFAAAAQPGTTFAADFEPQVMAPLWRVAGVTQFLWEPRYPGDFPTGFPGRDGAPQGDWHLRKIDDGLQPWPRAYLSQNPIVATTANRYAVLNKLATKPFAAPYPVVVEPDFPIPQSAPSGPTTVSLESATPDVSRWNISTQQDAIFVHQAALAPGWTAFVDNQRAPVYRVNGFFQGVRVPANAKRVAVVYDSQTLRFAFFLALCGLGSVALVSVSVIRDRKTTETQRDFLKLSESSI